MTDRELMQQALEALENSIDLVEEDYDNAVSLYGNYPSRAKRLIGMETMRDDHRKAITALRERLEQPEQKPFCFHDGRNIVGKEFADHSDVFPLYTASPLRQWQGLTEEDLFDIAIVNFGEPDLQLFIEMGKLVQEELKEKNT